MNKVLLDQVCSVTAQLNRYAPMRLSYQPLIAVLIFLTSCSQVQSFEGTDSLGSNTKLVLYDALPRSTEWIALFSCAEPDALGRFSYIKPDNETESVRLDFCLRDIALTGRAADAQLYSDGETVKICVSRDDGYCDDARCYSIGSYDVCSTFAIVEDGA